MREKGQVVVLLLLVMVVALAIGLSMISRSVTEVSTSRKSEDSSRAFSAAEAGIEKAVQANINNLGNIPVNVLPFNLGNQASTTVTIPTDSLPPEGIALEYPPFGKESFAQFWLANPSDGARSYTGASFDIYFGDPDINKYILPVDGGKGDPADKPAIEVSVIYWNNTDLKYQTLRRYFDSDSPVRSVGFNPCITPPSLPLPITVNNNTTSSFYCKVSVSGYPNTATSFPVMVRVRILYSNISHPVALKPTSCSPPTPCSPSLPKQANIYQSSGTSGSVRRTLEVFHEKAVMPQLFDYVLFSAKNLQKS